MSVFDSSGLSQWNNSINIVITAMFRIRNKYMQSYIQ